MPSARKMVRELLTAYIFNYIPTCCIVKEVVQLWEFGQLMGVVHKRTCAQATD